MMEESESGDLRDDGSPLALQPEDYPDVSHLITEDDTPVETIYVAKQYQLLTEPLECSWGRHPFVCFTNVGLFFANRNPPLVPDFLLSCNVTYPAELRKKENRSYLLWVYAKPPDVVGEIVSDKRGGEDTLKLEEYARHGIRYYFIYDPDGHLEGGELRVYGLYHNGYQLISNNWMEHVGLGLCMWEGKYADAQGRWLRWGDRDGKLIPTGAERAEELAERLHRAEEALRRAGLEPPKG
jgi:Uma2 family endonuclease